MEKHHLTVQANFHVWEGTCYLELLPDILFLFHMFSSGSSYTDNLQPFDRTIASTMSIEKTEPNKVCMNSANSPALQGHLLPLGTR